MPTPKFEKGRKKTGGRKPGVQNKLSIDVQKTAFEIFNALGGVGGATEYFKKNSQTKGQFYNIFYKMLPTNVVASGEILAKLRFDFGENGECKS